MYIIIVSVSSIIIQGSFDIKYYCYSGFQKQEVFVVRHSDNSKETIASWFWHQIKICVKLYIIFNTFYSFYR
jgi:hypothetical protein